MSTDTTTNTTITLPKRAVPALTTPTLPALTRRRYAGGRGPDTTPPKCAWVTLLMLGGTYAPGALALAESLRAVRTRHALVCMVTPDVPEELRATLRLAFDRVVEVPYIEQRARPLPSAKQRQRYGEWADRSFTKWNCLALTEYDRVMFVDADIVFIVNVDDLFELRPPAACFSLPWALPHQPDGGLPNPYLADGEAETPHGARIRATTILAALRARAPTFVGGGFLVLLGTGETLLARLRTLISAEKVYGEEHTAASSPDEIAICEFFARAGDDWTHIHQRYAAIPWKKAWVCRDIRGFHYHGGTKPWDMDPAAWPDLADWWAAAGRLREQHPGDAALRRLLSPPAARLLEPAALTGSGSGAAVTPLDADEAQFGLTAEIRSLVLSRVSPPTGAKTKRPPKKPRAQREARADALRREVDNILERWLMALVNEPAPEGSRVAWAQVYRRSTLEDDFNNKMAGELVEKQILSTPTEAGRLVVDILGLVDRRLATTPRPAGPARCTQDELSYGSRFRTARTPRLARLTEIGGCEQAVAVALRYAAVVSAGQQWGLPQRHVDALYRDCGVRGEAFASPLNSRLLGKPGAVFCSIFPDTDTPFGSVGSFFGLTTDALRARDWVVNPPFVEELLGRAARRVTEALSPEHPQTVFFIMPMWSDCAAFSLLHDSPYMVAAEVLVPGEYHFEDATGARVNTKATSIYFALSTRPVDARPDLAGALRNGMQ